MLAAGAFVVHRIRRRFERSHHVLDEHGNPVDPAALLDVEELEDVSNRALVAVDDALLTSNDELRHAEAEHKRHQTDGFRFTVDQGRVSMREAFRLSQQLDDSPTMPDQDTAPDGCHASSRSAKRSTAPSMPGSRPSTRCVT